jgi:signal transduction histidine kinase
MERRFSDLAAHQLRTPQAGIKLLLQLFARADTEDERKALLNDLMSSNERAMHMTEQLLGLARVSHQPVQLETVNLQNVTASALADFGGILDSRKFALELDGGEDALVHTDASLLRVMIDNVLDNAIKYSPAGSKIDVRIEHETKRWLLSISDEGPGIPPEERLAAFQRFNRLHANDREGAGLGLPIVADIARRLEIEIRLLVPTWGAGLRFEMAIPKP